MTIAKPICVFSGKRAYKTKDRANHYRRLTVASNIKSGEIGTKDRVLDVYRCHHCDHWHVGHKRVKVESPNESQGVTDAI